MPDIDNLAQRIAAAPFAPETWPDVLIDLAAETGGWSAQLVGVADGEFQLNIVGGFSEDLAAELNRRGGADPAVSPRAAALMRLQPLQLICDSEYVCDADRERLSIYRDFYERVDGHYLALGLLERTAGLMIAISVNYTRAQGPPAVDHRRRLSALTPALQSAAGLQMRVEDQASALTLRALETLGAPAAACDFAGRIVSLTRAAEELLSDAEFIGQRAGRLTAPHPASDRALQDALAHAVRPEAALAPRTVLLRSAVGARARTAEITPLPPGACGFRVGARVLITFGAPARKDAHALLEELGLTAAEAEVARALAGGANASAIAGRRGVSVETVRTQIKSVHAKLGVRRQAELMELLRHIL